MDEMDEGVKRHKLPVIKLVSHGDVIKNKIRQPNWY